MLYNPKADCLFWLRNCLTYKKALEARSESVGFIFGITGPLLDTVDDMLEWFDDHKGTMDEDTRNAYLCEVGKIQSDIRFYQSINANLLKEGFDA
nr:MAG TPA: hypothetical protein [Caudoviricetes sp.]